MSNATEVVADMYIFTWQTHPPLTPVRSLPKCCWHTSRRPLVAGRVCVTTVQLNKSQGVGGGGGGWGEELGGGRQLQGLQRTCWPHVPLLRHSWGGDQSRNLLRRHTYRQQHSADSMSAGDTVRNVSKPLVSNLLSSQIEDIASK
jgi:hypothetical protein